MTRTTKDDAAKRSQRLIVRLTDEDKARICANAQQAGLTLSEYVRQIAINGRIVIEQESGYSASLTEQLRRVGVNVNQLTRDYNTNGEYPPSLDRVAQKLELILDRILRVA